MKRILVTLMAATVALSFAACEQPAGNQSANTANANANTATPAVATPTAASLLEMDKAATAAYLKGETKWFEENLSDKFISYYDGKRMYKAEEIKMIAGMKCDVKSSTQDDAQMVKIDDNTYAVVYKSTIDGECAYEGNSMKIPTPTRAASVWIREGDKWKAAFHAETPIIDPKNPPAAESANKAAAKTPEANRADPKNAEAKKDDTAKADQALDAKADSKPTASSNTEALTRAHKAGWEAFMARNGKHFTEMMTSEAAIVDPMGNFKAGRDDIVTLWTETMKCEGITSVNFTDGHSVALSPTVELLTGRGSANGRCDGMANGDLYQSSVYVKEGDVWKMAFMFEAPARK
jgi:ketosteroid isomerase-like protein